MDDIQDKEKDGKEMSAPADIDLTPIDRMVRYTVYGKYCAKDFWAGEYCRFLRFKKFGTTPICGLFFEEELYQNLEQGGIERCTACLEEEAEWIQSCLTAQEEE